MITLGAGGMASGMNFSLNIGGQNLTVTYASGATASSLNGNAITIDTKTEATNGDIATDVANQINNFISNNATLKNNYVASGIRR